MSPASPSPGTPSRPRFEARPLSDRPGALWGVYRVQPWGSVECLAYGSRERCEGIAARLQAREDGR
jgi:hypothetical protein